jgi:hypothetical protein
MKRIPKREKERLKSQSSTNLNSRSVPTSGAAAETASPSTSTFFRVTRGAA